MARTNTLGDFLTDVADAIRTKKGSEELIAAEDFDTEIENLPSGSRTEALFNDVNFYDYDGFRVYSYTAQEFLALEEMPANPEHDGLTAQGWNWTLADAQDYVTDYGELNIGQNYTPTDAALRIHIELQDGRLSPSLNFAINGTATVDWGDDSATETVTDTSTSNLKTISHNYSSPGDYIINIVSENDIYILGDSGGIKSKLLLFSASGNIGGEVRNIIYAGCIREINLSNKCKLGDYALAGCYNLEKISIATGIVNTSINTFHNDYSLKSISVPIGFGTIGSNSFTSCYGLGVVILPKELDELGDTSFKSALSMTSFTFPKQITTIGTTVFNSCYCVAHFKIPNTFNDIPSSMFNACYGCAYYDFSKHTQIPTLGSGAFNNIRDDCKIIVPDDLYNDWIVANNWSNLASYIIKKSDWDALQNA